MAISISTSTLTIPPTIAKNIEQFTGRTWVLPPVLEWLEQSGEQLFLLTGGPGTGKSMLSAWLAGLGPAPVDAKAKGQLETIRAQVAATHFCIATSGNTQPRAMAKSVAEQLSRNVAEFAAILIETNKAEGNTYQIVNQTTIGTIEGHYTGINIELDIGSLDDEASFNQLLREPLKQLYATGYSKPLLLLIDSLDEATTYSGKIRIPQLLSKLTDFPAPVKFLVTTRPDPVILALFHQFKPFDLIADAPSNVDDIRLYVTQRLAAKGVGEENTHAHLAGQINQAAAGIFLYAYLVLEDETLLAKLLNIARIEALSLPKGLAGLYLDFLNRQWSENNEARKLLKRLLGLIAVSRGEGLNAKQLIAIIRKNKPDTDSEDVEVELRKCRQYLSGDIAHSSLRVFHQSFADFLLEDKDNTDYHIDAKEQHQRIADYYWRYHPDSWADSNPGDLYALRYQPTHLAKAIDLETDHLNKKELIKKLHELLLTFSWLQAKLDATDVFSLIDDYNFLTSDTDLSLVKEALRLSAHILAENKIQLAGQLIGRLLTFKVPEIEVMLEQAKQQQTMPWLCPLTSSLNTPGEALLLTLAGHNTTIQTVVSTPSGENIISASSDGALKVWDLWSEQSPKTLSCRSSNLIGVAITYDGTQIAASSSSSQGGFTFWDLQSGRTLKKFSYSNHDVTALAVSPNNQRVVSGSHSDLIIWNLQTGEPLKIIRDGHDSWVSALTVSHNGRIISASWDNSLKVWDLQSGMPLKTLKGHTQLVTAVAITPDEQKVVSASDDDTLRVWDLQSGEPLRTINCNSISNFFFNGIKGAAISPDGQQIVSASGDGTLKVWDLHSGDLLKILGNHASPINGITITPTGKVISGAEDGTLKVWDLYAEQVLTTPKIDPRSVTAIAIIPNKQQAVTAQGNSLKVWDLQTGKQVKILNGHTDWITAVAVHPVNEEQIVSSSADGTLKVWDLQSEESQEISIGDQPYDEFTTTKHISSVSITPNGQQIVAAIGSEFKIFDFQSRQEVKTIGKNRYGTGEFALTPDSEKMVSINGNTLKVWDLVSGKPLQIIKEDSMIGFDKLSDYKFTSVAITSSGENIISASNDGTLKVWNLKSGQKIKTITAHPQREASYSITVGVTALSIMPSGQQAVTVGSDKTLKIWDLATSNIITSFSSDSSFSACAITLDGKIIVAGEASGALHFLKYVESNEKNQRIDLEVKNVHHESNVESGNFKDLSTFPVINCEVDYSHLDRLLSLEQWREADEETMRIMLQVVEISNGILSNYIDIEIEEYSDVSDTNDKFLPKEMVQHLPCEVLRTINQLWLQHSNGHFGFSVQKRIWESIGGQPWRFDNEESWLDYYERLYKEFSKCVGWYGKTDQSVEENEWLFSEALTFSLNAHPGHLPFPLRNWSSDDVDISVWWGSAHMGHLLLCQVASCGL